MNDKWDFVKILGEGWYGRAELFQNTATGDKIVLKTPLDDGFNSVNWEREVNIAYQLQHTNAVEARRVPAHLKKSAYVLGMEYCDGGTLKQMFQKRSNFRGFNEPEAINALRDLCQGLLYLHSKRIIHRDLKPENIFIKNGPHRKIYKLGDFGLSKQLNNNGYTTTIVGTGIYMAPEIQLGRRYTETVDYWSFGFIAMHVITGMTPFYHRRTPENWLDLMRNKSDKVIFINSISGRTVELTHLPKWSKLLTAPEKPLTACLRKVLAYNPATRSSGDHPPLATMLDILPTNSLFVFDMRSNHIIPASSTISDELLALLNKPKEYIVLTSQGKRILDTKSYKSAFTQVSHEPTELQSVFHIFSSNTRYQHADVVPTEIKLLISGQLSKKMLNEYKKYAHRYVTESFHFCCWTFSSCTALTSYVRDRGGRAPEYKPISLQDLEQLHKNMTKSLLPEQKYETDHLTSDLKKFKSNLVAINRKLFERVNDLLERLCI